MENGWRVGWRVGDKPFFNPPPRVHPPIFSDYLIGFFKFKIKYFKNEGVSDGR